jgi:uncharacterized Zn finger protein (UPF0148 family)
MKKYNIEGNIDFFSELYKSLDEEDNKHKVESDNNLCLITNQLLIDKFVELNCGHKFNYIPLYNDIYNHKKKFNNMEGSTSLLKMNEIRCPYCRKKLLGVLPYYEGLISEKTNGVNFYDNTLVQNNICTNTKPIYSYVKCEYIMPIPPICLPTGSYTGCPVNYTTKIEYDGKSYCYNHIRIMTKKYEKEKKDKEKAAQKKLKEEIKQKDKEDKKEKDKKIKADEKLLKKTLKQSKNLILSITDVEDENLVVSINPQIQIINECCVQIIKTGLNKGNACGLEILNECLCKRHYNLKNKK